MEFQRDVRDCPSTSDLLNNAVTLADPLRNTLGVRDATESLKDGIMLTCQRDIDQRG